MKKIIVFGGSGFLGSHICDILSDKGFDVSIFDVYKSKYKKKNQKIIIGSILDKNLVEKSIKSNDYVYHLAGIADIHEAKEKSYESAETNILGTINILKACVKFNVKRLFFASTVYVYSSHGSFYRVSKQSCELYLESFQQEFGLNYTILRYGSLYGTRANSFNFIRKAIDEALKEKKITRAGDGKEVRSYINVIDAAKISCDLFDEKYVNQHIMITGSQSNTVGEILDMINEILNNEIKIVYKNEKMDGHYKLSPYSFKPKVALKITPKEYHDLGQGILECIYEQNKDIK